MRKFDICLMNPPYDHGLHLDFLEKTISVCDKTISIQPIQWINYYPNRHNKKSLLFKYKKSVFDHIKDLEEIDDNNIFDVRITADLGILECDDNGGFPFPKYNSVLNKVYIKLQSSLSMKDKIKEMTPDNGLYLFGFIGRQNIKDFTELFLYDDYKHNTYIDGKRLDNGLSFYENRIKVAFGTVGIKETCYFLKFDTEEECKNFFYYTKLYLFRYIFNHCSTKNTGGSIDYKWLPYMEDYTHEWTDKMLYDYFNITKEEQDEIEKEVNQYLRLWK